MARIPEKVGKYKILSLIGKGGMGLVYAAEHPTLKRKIILKKLTIRDKEFRERFRLEADIMMDLRSDYIVDMYDHFREGSSYYIAMEFIEGITLEDLIKKEGSLDNDLLVYIMSCTAKALEYIHDRGIIHRDIKPSNIYISKTGEVKLGDFGIAASASRDIKITDSGSAMGTPAYMAPEQFNDSSTVDKRADLFSFGVTLYESITGLKPFQADKYTELKQEINRGKYKGLSTYKKKIPFYLKWMIFRSLMVKPSLRTKDIKSICNRFKHELRKVRLVQIKEQLSDLTEVKITRKSNNLTEIVKEKEKRSFYISFKLLIPVIFIVFFIFLLISGGIYRIFLPSAYGALNLQMVPSVADGKYSLYSEKTPQLKQIKTGSFNSKGNASIILKEGSYRVKIESGSHVSWRSVYISSFKDSGGDEIDLTVLSSPIEQFPVDFNFNVKDRFSGMDLSAEIVVEIKDGNQWKLLDKTVKDSLKSGEIIDIRFDHKGYVSGLYTLDVAYYQTAVNLDVLMTPEAAILNIHPQRNMIRINGKEEYFSLKTLRFEKIPQKAGHVITFLLIPGKYVISVEFDGKSHDETLNLKSGKNTEFPATKQKKVE